jgi:hypothetical protein
MTKKRSQGLLVLGAAIILVLGMNIYSTYTFLTSRVPGHNDFLSRWEGARSFWIDGNSPYSDEASLNIQTMIYGRPALDGEDASLFVYPFFTVFLLWPLTYVSYAWAAAIWMVILEALLVAALLLICHMVGWRPRPLMFTMLIIWTLIYYPAARGLMLGQPGHLVYFLEIVALWGLYKGQGRLAGAALALSTIKPQMGILLIPFLLLWGLRNRNWPFLGAFAVTGLALAALSFLFLPDWVYGWLYQVRLYPTYTDVGSPIETVVEVFLGLSPLITQALSLGLVGAMLFCWYTVLVQRRDERFLWVVTLTLITTSLAMPRVSTPQYITFSVLMVVVGLDFIRRRVRPYAGLWMALVLVALLVLPWAHFLMTIEGSQEHISLYVPLPFVALALMWLTRRMWWRDVPVVPAAVTLADDTGQPILRGDALL